MGWFGPSKDEVWRQLSQEIGAEFVKGGLWKGNKVQAHVGPWIDHLGHLHRLDRKNGKYLTHECVLPYVNPEGFRFTIYRKSIFSDLGKLLGMQDIEVGDPDFDEAFIIKGNDESKVRELLRQSQDPPDDPGSAQDPAGGEGQRGLVRSQVPGGRG